MGTCWKGIPGSRYAAWCLGEHQPAAMGDRCPQERNNGPRAMGLGLQWVRGHHGAMVHQCASIDGGGDPVATGFNYGNTFLYTAGLMNLLTVLDVSDISRGEKD